MCPREGDSTDRIRSIPMRGEAKGMESEDVFLPAECMCVPFVFVCFCVCMCVKRNLKAVIIQLLLLEILVQTMK